MYYAYVIHFTFPQGNKKASIDQAWLWMIYSSCPKQLFWDYRTRSSKDTFVYGGHSKWISLISAPDSLLMPSSISFLVFRLSVRVLFHIVQTVAMTSSWCWTHTDIFVAHFEVTNDSPPWCWLFIYDTSAWEHIHCLPSEYARKGRPALFLLMASPKWLEAFKKLFSDPRFWLDVLQLLTVGTPRHMCLSWLCDGQFGWLKNMLLSVR